ncbi:nickel pincer cofactor biosynthesis protein LarC [Pseudodesulfovibrio cashew]|uniref:Putative nickel insertion protein n=1 Tax=Pseudodesulfovibrio cashew TaxID=2678688 RepID=A0A6I6JLY0_9BACT|nr:nickel pincer cofactor biosynthesis protein LarC [Pseudodesulfovibrio cashew]QGY42028.1 nickel pincer cofactor biosynthesis protein LarC [Pseudodesulfovibrio cashew]
MKILYYDCFSGISGDMNLAAMIDLGVEPDHLRAELDKLGLGDEFELVVTRDARNGIHGTRVDVRLAGEPHEHGHAHGHGDGAANDHDHEQHHAHGHTHGDQAHEHTHGEHVHGHHHAHDAHGHAHGEGGDAHKAHAPHRDFAAIRTIIAASTLDHAVKETSLRIFRRVAEAEAKVHGKSVDEVHFHEVGATDSIVDIVGAAICYHSLGVDAVLASPVELGSGFVRCAHGVIPVPAPATAEILQGIPTTRGGTDIEATTPTGAAILAALVDEFTVAPAMTATATGYGIGHKETARPNLLRVHLADAELSGGPRTSRARLLQCNIDDMTGELLGGVMDLLMEEGAMDVHFAPIVMKKNRPATMVSVLCDEDEEPRFKELLFRHTTTLGVKSFSLEKTELERRFEKVETPLGPVTMKRALLNGEVLHSKPEFEECREIARNRGIPLVKVYDIIGGSE